MEACSEISSYQRWETKSEAFVCGRRKDITISVTLLALSILGIAGALMRSIHIRNETTIEPNSNS